MFLVLIDIASVIHHASTVESGCLHRCDIVEEEIGQHLDQLIYSPHKILLALFSTEQEGVIVGQFTLLLLSTFVIELILQLPTQLIYLVGHQEAQSSIAVLHLFEFFCMGSLDKWTIHVLIFGSISLKVWNS